MAQFDEYEEESHAQRMRRKVKENPYVPIGLAGCLGAVAYGVIQFKNRGAMSPSVYVMKFRVIAQGAVVCMLGLGAGMTIINEHLLPKMRSMQNEADKKEWFAKNSTS